MIKRIYILLSVLCFISCSKIDNSVIGKGEIRYDGRTYQLKNVYQYTSKTGGVTLNNDVYHSYFHALYFVGATTSISAILEIRAEDIELSSGEFHVGQNNIRNDYDYVKVSMELDDDFVYYAHSNMPSIKLNLKYTKEEDILEFELTYADDSESDFLIKWKGPLKEWWTWSAD